MTLRQARKAGSWYERDPTRLAETLNRYMDQVTSHDLPIRGARMIIAPHAGYSYSGPCAAWAYRHLDLRGIKKVFILGPSHTYYLDGVAFTTFDQWATPFGNFRVDKQTLSDLQALGDDPDIPPRNDENEHSMELHLPYLWMRCQETFDDPQDFPSIVPIMVGAGGAGEQTLGRRLQSYISQPDTAFIISSDFCHWGDHFSYLPYSAAGTTEGLRKLQPDGVTPNGAPIHETIAALDRESMEAIQSGSYDAFRESLRKNKNTVCGRHPISAALAALEGLGMPGDGDKGRFKVIKYDRSNMVLSSDDFSVSYVAAYAVI